MKTLLQLTTGCLLIKLAAPALLPSTTLAVSGHQPDGIFTTPVATRVTPCGLGCVVIHGRPIYGKPSATIIYSGGRAHFK